MMSKLNFRARTLDASKPLAIYHADELPDLAALQAINRSVPAMPSGMEKEEEGEKHLQDILVLQEKGPLPEAKVSDLVIPTPEVFCSEQAFNDLYRPGFKLPRQFLHVQPFSTDHDLPDYDMDSEDESFLNDVLRKEKKFEVNEITFEDMLDRLEKHSGHSVINVKEAKLHLKEDDELILAVYDYWMDKRLRLKQPLIPQVKQDKRDGLNANANSAATSSNSSPYIAFRRRTEKMQTRKNRKNDEVSYEKMLKLRRDLAKAVTLLDLVRRREKSKKENLNLTVDIFEKRFTAGDFDGRIIGEILAARQAPPRVLQPSYLQQQRQYSDSWNFNQGSSRAEKRQYKKKKHKKASHHKVPQSNGPEFGTSMSSDDERSSLAGGQSPELEEDLDVTGPYAFHRKRNCQYLAPLTDDDGNDVTRGEPWEHPAEGGLGEAKFKYSLASISDPRTSRPKCVGMVRRRVGRGGRVILDRAFANHDDFWRSLDFTVYNGRGQGRPEEEEEEVVVKQEPDLNGSAMAGGDLSDLEMMEMSSWPHYRPVTPPHCKEEEWDPYRSRLSETPVGLPTQPVLPRGGPIRGRLTGVISGASSAGVSGLRTVDSIIAQNAASAVVSNEILDLLAAKGQNR